MPTGELTAAAFAPLLEAVLDRATHRHSSIHGERHWRAVTFAALSLAPRVERADPLVGFLFGLIHDSQRLDDGHDPDHGPRAASFARELFAEGLLPVTGEQLDPLVIATHGHTTGRRHDDPTVAVCWDADRLNLWRLGIEPRPEFLSTAAARDPETIAAHRSLPGEHTPWEELRQKLVNFQ